MDWQKIKSALLTLGVLVALGLSLSSKIPGCDQPTPVPPLPPAPVVPISLPEKIQGKPGEKIILHAETKGEQVRWYGKDKFLWIDIDPHTIGLLTLTPGEYHILAWTSLKGIPTDAVECIVTVGTPVPPSPPVPPAPPVPPEPPAPIPEAGLRVLMVYETAEATPSSQLLIMQSMKVREWLNQHCVKGPDGKTAEFRVWDQNVNTAGESKIWQDAMKRTRTKLPWVIISNPGKGGGFEGPMPNTVDEFMALVQKYDK